MSKLRLIVVDEHPVVTVGLAAMLGTQLDFDLVASVNTYHEGWDAIRQFEPAVVLLDLGIPKEAGLNMLRRATRERVPTRMLAFASCSNPADVASALDAGARGYVLKTALGHEVFSAIRTVARGKLALSTEIEHGLKQQQSHQTRLSPRELQVTDLVAHGLCNRTIAQSLCISEATVKTHLVHIFSKLGQGHRTGVVTEAIRRGLISINRAAWPPERERHQDV